MDNNIESIKIFLSTAFAGGVSLIGVSFKYIVVLILLMFVDTIFGWIMSKKNGEWKLSTAKSGFIGKIIELIFVGVLYLLDWIFETDFLKYLGVFYFGICEIASIVENYSGINKNLPDGFTEIINKLKFNFGNFAIKKIFEKIFDFKENDDN